MSQAACKSQILNGPLINNFNRLQLSSITRLTGLHTFFVLLSHSSVFFIGLSLIEIIITRTDARFVRQLCSIGTYLHENVIFNVLNSSNFGL